MERKYINMPVIVLIGNEKYAYRDEKSHKYPWYCCQNCGCTNVGFIGRIMIALGLSKHHCIIRRNDGYDPKFLYSIK